MMGVKIEDSDTAETLAQGFGGNRGVVQEAEAGGTVDIGVVARRAA